MAALAYADVFDLRVELHLFEPFAQRVWDLRENVTAYDAWYVAIAEALEIPLVTLDHRLAAAPGLRCEVLIPPTS
jgi:predicted nucleic acid-binding protein